MITRIQVNGFKTLSNFDLKLKTGLNILVGPNGVGKTNIILFFEFLSQLTNNQIGHAVSAVGGAGSIFKKTGLNEYENDIDFKIFGSQRLGSKKTLTYEYEAKITTSFEKDIIFFNYQRIKLRTGSKFWDDSDGPNYQRGKWDLDVEYRQIEGKPEVSVEALNTDKFEMKYMLRMNEDDTSGSDAMVQYLKDSHLSLKIIVNSLFPFADMHVHWIRNDLNGGETFNVVPSKVKEQEDAATPPGIKKDGSGLATTLYAMKKSRPRESNTFRLHIYFGNTERTYDPGTLKKIVGYLKLANRTIKDLEVMNDPFNNKLIVRVTIQTGEYMSVLPLSAMSDGTIKWLALITAILTSKTIFSIEEPENFLHPWMQAEISNIIREHVRGKDRESFVLMTTHSESLLNHSEPGEILLVELNEGRTTAKRLADVDLIKEEISNSGFGLGHFYFSNVLN